MDIKQPVNNNVGSNALSTLTFSHDINKYLLAPYFVYRTVLRLLGTTKKYPTSLVYLSPLYVWPSYILQLHLLIFLLVSFPPLEHRNFKAEVAPDAASTPLLSLIMG